MSKNSRMQASQHITATTNNIDDTPSRLIRLNPTPHGTTKNRTGRSNIEAHYDLSNELFKTFLDTDYMLYSCGIFHADMGR